MSAIAESSLEHHTVRYEDLVSERDRRAAIADRLAAWLGVPNDELQPLVVGGLDPVMATAPPRPGRWRARADELSGVLADERTLALAERLGYARDPDSWG